MHERKKVVIKRTLFGVIMVMATVSLFVMNHEMNRGATYPAVSGTVTQMAQAGEAPVAASERIPEPADAYTVVTITLGGNCTPASMLGSDTYGTFNALAAEEGAAYFLSGLQEVFANDYCTVLGCAAVLSDDDTLSPKRKEKGEVLEWYLAPAKAGEIFSSSGVELVSADNDRIRDYGSEGTGATKASLEAAGVTWTDSGAACYFEKAGISVGILGTSLAEGANSDGILAWVEKAEERCAYVIAYVNRFPAEGDYYDRLGETLIDAGCDVVCYVGYSDGTAEAISYGDGVIVDSLGYLIDGGDKFPEG